MLYFHLLNGTCIILHITYRMQCMWIQYECKCRKDFVAYADVCFREFGDRVLHWTTFNEANVFALVGYDFGTLPPGRCSSTFGINCTRGNSSIEPYTVAHNILLAHTSVARLYLRKYKVFNDLLIRNCLIHKECTSVKSTNIWIFLWKFQVWNEPFCFLC